MSLLSQEVNASTGLTEREASEINYASGCSTKWVITRKDHYCYNSGFSIYKGSKVERTTVYPGCYTGRRLGLDKPRDFYKCGRCGACTH